MNSVNQHSRKYFFNFNFLLLFNYSCVPFLPIPPPCPIHTPLPPQLHPAPSFCPCVLYSSSCKPLSSLSPPHSPLAIVRLFLISMSLVIFCFFLLLIMFQLNVRSYGICFSLTGLFCLAYEKMLSIASYQRDAS